MTYVHDKSEHLIAIARQRRAIAKLEKMTEIDPVEKRTLLDQARRELQSLIANDPLPPNDPNSIPF